MAVRERCSDTCSSLTEPEVHIDVAKLPGRSEREKVDSLKNSFPEIKPTSDLTQRPRNPTTQGRLRSCWLTSASMTNPARLCMSLPRPPPPRSLFRRHKLIGPTNRANPEKWPLGHSCILPTAGRQTCTACPSQCVLFCMSVRGVGTDAAVGDGSDPGGWNRRRRGGGTPEPYLDRGGNAANIVHRWNEGNGQRAMEGTPRSSESMGDEAFLPIPEMSSLPCNLAM